MRKAVIGIALLFLLTFAGNVDVFAAPRAVSDWSALELAVLSATPGDRIEIAGDLEADGEITVDIDLIISGGGHTVQPKSGYLGRAFSVKDAAVTIEDTRFAEFCHIDADAAAGGAVLADGAALKLDRCTFSDNYSDNSGGALYQRSGTLEVSGCSFLSNAARTYDGKSGFGGAVFSDGADAVFQDSIFTGNRAGRYGGAVYYTYNKSSTGKETLLSGCTFEGNEADAGGGAVYVRSRQKPLAIDDCTFAGNRTADAGAGGGAVTSQAQHTNVYGSSFVKNTSDGEGPALLAISGLLTLDANMFDRNTRGGSYEYGEDVALSYGYGVTSLALTVEGGPYGGSMDIGECAELFVGSDSADAPFVIETDGGTLAIEDGGRMRAAAGGYAGAFSGGSSGKAYLTLREYRGKAYAVLDVTVSTLSAKRTLTGLSFAGIKNTKTEIQGQAVYAEVPAGTDVARLIPEIEYEGASISPEYGVPTDFSSPVTYTVTAQNGKTRDYTVTVRVRTGGLIITGIPDNLIVYAGGRYTLKASLPGGKWSYYALTAAAETEEDGNLVLTPCGAGGGWVEYEAESGGETQRRRIYFSVVPSMLPMTGQTQDGIALLVLCAALCVAALKVLPYTADA